jgi:hypothetical protein
MEVLRKQNEELNARITAAEARSSEKERERAERREKERRDRIHREKRPVNPRQEDNESTVQGENEENCDKSRRTNEGSRRDRTHREESPRQESRREESRRSREKRGGEERSHRSRRHRDKSHHEGTRQSHQEAKMKDLEDKYTRMLRRMDGEDPGLMTWDMLEDESLPFTGLVKAYPMPDKFKMPRIEKYDGNGDPQEHLEAFREHIVLHGTPDEIACRAFPLTLKGVAKDWFTGLPPKSVGTFKDL